jgi:hypothetical protein
MIINGNADHYIVQFVASEDPIWILVSKQPRLQSPPLTIRVECVVAARSVLVKGGKLGGIEESVLQLMVIRTDEHGISERVDAEFVRTTDTAWASLNPKWRTVFLL